MKKHYVVLLIIFIAGCFFRFYRLGEVPIGLHRDEAFLGYNAYSILKTGRDMNGSFLPLHLKSFINSPAGYAYFSIPFIFSFDLSRFSVRFASAFFGSLTVLLTYFLAKELFGKNSKLSARLIALFSAGFLSISPWHISLSRTATENVIVVFFVSLGVLLYLLWLKKDQPALLIGSLLSFGITLFLYQAPRAFLPLFMPLVIFSFLKVGKDRKKIVLSLALLLMFVFLPLAVIFSSKDLSLRIRTVSIFSTDQTQLVLNQQIREDGVSHIPTFVGRLFHNKVVGYSSQFFQNYFKHFSYDFLFTDQGFPDRYRVPLVGLLYLFELPLLFCGIWCLFRDTKRIATFLLGWILLVPIGSAFTFDDIPNLQRTVTVFPALSMLTAYGLGSALSLRMLARSLKSLIIFLFLVIAVYQLMFYLHEYYAHVNTYRPWYRNDGYERLVYKVNESIPKYSKAVITNRESAPTIFFLFFAKYDPLKFQKETQNTTFADFDRINFDKYEFSQEECPLGSMVKDQQTMLLGQKDVLYVNSSLCKVVKGTVELEVIKRSDRSEVFRILSLP